MNLYIKRLYKEVIKLDSESKVDLFIDRVDKNKNGNLNPLMPMRPYIG